MAFTQTSIATSPRFSSLLRGTMLGSNVRPWSLPMRRVMDGLASKPTAKEASMACTVMEPPMWSLT